MTLMVAGIVQTQAIAQNTEQHVDASHACGSPAVEEPGILSRLYVGVDGGMQRTSIRNMDRPGNDSDWRAAANFNSSTTRWLVGYRFQPGLALEFGYLPGFSLRQKSNTHLKKYDAGDDMEGVDLALVYKFTKELPGLFLKGGASYIRNRSGIRYDVMHTGKDGKNRPVRIGESIKGSGLGFVGGIGYEVKLTDSLGVNVMYTRYQGIAGHNYSAMDFVSVGAKYYF